jgi:hypothetical protein
MRTEIIMEGLGLDISTEISALLTFALDDVKDFSSRSTTFSKTIVLPGTANNNNIFGNIFQVGQSNFTSDGMPNVGYNFNASKAADCLMFTDQIQTFSGILRLMRINIIKGRPEYEVSVYGKIAGLNVSLSGQLLENLDFSEYDEVLNTTNIINSWDNASGAGVYYPLIDYGTYGSGGTGKRDWDIRTFRPALFAKEYIDKMFAAANFRYDCPLFETTRFKKLVVPNNQKKLFRLTSSFVTATKTVSQEIIYGDNDFTLSYAEMPFDTVTTASNFDNIADTVFQYNQASTINARIRYRIKGAFAGSAGMGNLLVGVTKNLSGTPDLDVSDFVNYHSIPPGVITINEFEATGDFFISLAENDTVSILAEIQYGGGGYVYSVGIQEAEFYIEGQTATQVEVAPGETIEMNNVLPRNVRQVDFLVSIIKLFNLYVYEDRFDPTLIYIKPFIDFYSTDSTNSVDWTYKLNRDKPIRIIPMSELNAKKYEFKWKSDSDYYNELYRKRYGQGYGDYIFDSQYEFAEQTKAFELIFSSTPLVGYAGEDKVFPTIFKRSGPENAPVEENVDSNIRLMQTKKLTGLSSWSIKDGVTVLFTGDAYGYAGHFDDPDAPLNDLNFGVSKELFFVLAGGNVSATQFNVFWSGYMAEITDKDSKLLTGSFYLTSSDILNLDFSKFIYLDGVLFRLNKIEDYNMSKPSECTVQLVKINYLIY